MMLCPGVIRIKIHFPKNLPETVMSGYFFFLRYDGETFIKEVRVNYMLWEQHGRTGYTYSATMKQVHQYDIASVRGVRRKGRREGKGPTPSHVFLVLAIPEISWRVPTLSNLHLAGYIMYIT